MNAFEALLLEKQICSKEDIEQAKNIQEEYGGRVADILINMGAAPEAVILRAEADYYGLGFYRDFQEKDTDTLSRDFEKKYDIPVSFFVTNNIYPFAVDAQHVKVAVNDPLQSEQIFFLKEHLSREIERYLATSEEIDQLRQKYEEDEADDALSIGDFEDEVDKLKELASEAPIIKLVNNIFTKAAELGASDIHFEAFKSGVKVRIRVDGIMRLLETVSNQFKAALTARLKLISKMNISENRLPQDGRITMKISGKDIDIRASSVPTAFGESFVLRLLRRESIQLEIEKLGMHPDTLETLLGILKRPNGIFLTTGPTGSGKTSTLYAALNHIQSETIKIMTVEDPVEYQLEGVNQIQVNSDIDYTFANSLRSILRQDPDIIMIGEIRDVETAEIAIQAALTGHLVLSTLHTNSALGAITRLLDMGVEYYLLKSSIVGLMAQRLARRLCKHCKAPVEIDPEVVAMYRLDELREQYPFAKMTPHKKVGCPHCNHTGYSGRIPLIEITPFDQKVIAHFEQDKNFSDIRALGQRSLFQDGLLRYLEGETTLEEVSRIQHETDL
jgi:general secretion pathway protein E